MKQCVKKQNNKSKTLTQSMTVFVMFFIFATFVHAGEDRRPETLEQTFNALGLGNVQMSVDPLVGAIHESPLPTVMLPYQPDGTFAPHVEISVGPFRSDQPFNLIGAQWEETVATGITQAAVRVRTRTNHNSEWSAWQELERLRDTPDDKLPPASTVQTEPLVVETSREVEARIILSTIDPQVTPEVSNFELTAIGTEDERTKERKNVVKISLNEDNQLKIISRAEWGADEALRYDETGQDRWPETYGQVRAFVIHHTGGSNGGTDSAAAVRAIQRYHAKTLKWGDIGYNYLIAPDGTIFEGRRGSEGAVGGHTYNDAKKLGYNTGSIGIAILGNYEGRDSLTDTARESLSKLIAAKSFEHEITPDGEARLKDVAIPAVVAHKDIDATICPGSGITVELIRVRQLSREILQSRGGLAAISRKATLLNQSDTTVLVKPGQSKTIFVTYRNDGNTNWKNYLDEPVQLADALVKNRLAALSSPVTAALVNSQLSSRGSVATVAIPGGLLRYARNDKEIRVKIAQVVDDEVRPTEQATTPLNVTTFPQSNVAPGETVRIPVTISVAPDAYGAFDRRYVLVWGSLGYFPGSEFTVTVETTEVEWAGRVEEITIPTSTMSGITTNTKVAVRNRGLKTWMKGSIFLILTDPAGAPSKWRMRDSPLSIGRLMFNESIVRPNELATFPLNLSATDPGVYESRVTFKYLPDHGLTPTETLIDVLRLPDLKGAEGGSFTTVTPSGHAEFIKPKLPARIRTGRAVTVQLRVKNIGDKPWEGGRATTLTQTRADGQTSPFYDKADWLSELEPAYLWELALKPKQTGTFTWRLRAPKAKGTYTERLTLTTSEGLALINGKPEFTFTIKVE